MPAQQTVIEFHDTYCRIYSWQSAKGELTLQRQIRVPLKSRPAASAPSPQVPEPGAAIPVPDSTDTVESNGAAIKAALKDAGLRTGDVMVVIPKQWVNLRVVTLPSGDPGELAEMARFEAERHIPFDAERHIIAHYVVRTEEIEGSQVVIAALDRPPAEEVTGTLTAAGIMIRNLDVSTTALCNALVQSGQWDGQQDATVAQIDIGETSTDINILHNGMLVFARSIALGVDRLLEAPVAPRTISLDDSDENDTESASEGEPEAQPIDMMRLQTVHLMSAASGDAGASGEGPAAWFNRLIQEVQRTYGYAHREFDCQPLTRIFVSGIGTAIPEIANVLRMVLEADTELLEPLHEPLKNGLTGKENDLPEAAFALAAGALEVPRQENPTRLNLLPEDYIRKHRQSRRKQSLLTTVTLIVALVVCAFVFADQTQRERARQLAYYEAQVRKSDARAKELERKRMVLKILKQNSGREGSPLAILDSISSWADLLEEGRKRLAISEFRYENRKFVKMTGDARTYKDLDEFVTRLEQSGHFQNVLLQSRTSVAAPHAPRAQVVRFTLMCYFRSSESEKAYDY